MCLRVTGLYVVHELDDVLGMLHTVLSQQCLRNVPAVLFFHLQLFKLPQCVNMHVVCLGILRKFRAVFSVFVCDARVYRVQ